ncbi:uncharacterized protein LOC123695208 [Colias croceus]|uniref:uncharacterized protein LOC123695208 n=1 Tax=Colias crocea TaxID=72248 RepID=UPI001E27F2E3|nr:uncharacterized protein LOC123695208 [Colias croceus]
MESISQKMAEMTEMFTYKMDEFQRDLKNNNSATRIPSEKLASEFHVFRTFVMSSLSCLQSQVNLLNQLYDQQEMRSRRKMLLIHGVTESKDENPSECVSKLISDHLELATIVPEVFSRCHRMGVAKTDKPRPILVKFQDAKIRNQVWLAKTKLKGTAITLSEFLTKCRHEVFMAARKKFGVSKCWTKDGSIFVINADGVRQRISTIADIEALQPQNLDGEGQTITASASTSQRLLTQQNSRARRVQKQIK